VPHKEIFIFIPENFDPMAVLPADLAQYADCARYSLHRIIWARVQRNITPEGYVPIKWDYLRKVIPDRVLNRIKTALLSHNVIACDNYYIEGNKSYGLPTLFRSSDRSNNDPPHPDCRADQRK
jgi:hypothetical protein